MPTAGWPRGLGYTKLLASGPVEALAGDRPADHATRTFTMRALCTRLCLAASLGILAGLTATGANAQDPGTLVTDRSDQTESAASVPAGLVQIELGWTVSREASDPSEAVTVHNLPGDARPGGDRVRNRAPRGCRWLAVDEISGTACRAGVQTASVTGCSASNGRSTRARRWISRCSPAPPSRSAATT